METEVPDKIVEKLKKLMRLQEGAKRLVQKVKQMQRPPRSAAC